MELEFEFDKNSSVKLLRKIPDTPRLKLLGYNGIGKTLTANMLASISGQSVWANQTKIDSLAKYLPYFIATLTIKDKKYKIEADVTKWKVDPISGAIQADSVGRISLNGTKIPPEQFWDEFKCHIVRGNEDINSQIEIMANGLERTILYSIDNFAKKLKSFTEDYETLYELLTWNELYSEILADERDIKKANSKEMDFSVITTVERFISDIKKVNNLVWLSLEGPKKSLSNITELNKQIKSQILVSKSRIEYLRGKIPSNEEEQVEKYRKLIVDYEAKLKNIELPLSEKEYPTTKATKEGKIYVMTKIDSVSESLKEYNSFKFRKDFCQIAFRHLRVCLEDYQLGLDTNIFLKTNKRDAITVQELEEWHYDSVKTDQKRLEKLSAYKVLQGEIEKLKEKARKFDEQEKKLIEKKDFKIKFEMYNKKYKSLLGTLSELEQLPPLETQFNILERDSKAFDFIEESLKNMSQHDSWFDLVGKTASLNDNNDLIHMLAELTESAKDITKLKKRIDSEKQEYIKHLKRDSKKLRVPDILQKLIDKEDVISLCKISSTLSSPSVNIVSYLKEECKTAIKSISDKNEGDKEQSLFISEANQYIGNKIKFLLNKDAFRKHLFNGSEIVSVDPQKNKLNYVDKDKNPHEKFIADYSTGEKAFAFSMASIFYAIESSVKNNLLILDEFGAMLAIDKENYLYNYLNRLQSEKNWPDQYIIVLPYKGEFDRDEYKIKHGKKIEQLKDSLKDRGYAFEEL